MFTILVNTSLLSTKLYSHIFGALNAFRYIKLRVFFCWPRKTDQIKYITKTTGCSQLYLPYSTDTNFKAENVERIVGTH